MRIVVVGPAKSAALTAQLTAENNDIVVIDQNPELIEDIVNIYDVRECPAMAAAMRSRRKPSRTAQTCLSPPRPATRSTFWPAWSPKTGHPAHHRAYPQPGVRKQLHFMRDELACRWSSTRRRPPRGNRPRAALPTAIKREQFCRQRFELIEYRLADDNPLVGLQLADLYRNIRVKILICAVARGSETIIPTGSTTLQAGIRFT